MAGHDEIKTYHLTPAENSGIDFVIKRMKTIYKAMEGSSDKPHRHNYFTIIISEKAQGKHFIDFHEYEINDQSINFIYPGQVHQVITPSEPSGWVINFNKLFLLKNGIRDQIINDVYLYNESGESPPLKCNPEIFSKFRHLLQQMEETSKTENNFKYESLGALLKLFLIQCNNICSTSIIENPQTVESGNTLLRSFKQLLDESFTTTHKVNEYADMLAVSSDYLNKTIKTLTGRSVKDHIQDRIILESKRLILFTDSSSKELAYSLGFSEPAHFSNFFKKHTGLSVSQFRTQSRQN